VAYYQFAADEVGTAYGSCEVFFMSAADVRSQWRVHGWDGFAVPSELPFDLDCATDNPADLAGWYWQACFPGCLPDSDPMGPFPTEEEAMADALVDAHCLEFQT
jgi:hypothetical protein